jgi:hypothetical protein
MTEKTVKLSRLLEVWESFSGWYWFVTERHDDGICFGLVRGHETEWGYFSVHELRRLAKRWMVWKVPKRNWRLCPCVEDDTIPSSGGERMTCAFCNNRIAECPITDGETGEELWICFVCDDKMEWHDVRMDELGVTMHDQHLKGGNR